MDMSVPGYTRLADVLQRAYDQAARTKGAERHANNLPFHEQPMQTVARHHGMGFLLGQAQKKAIEAHNMLKRGETGKAQHELLGAINYLAGSVIFIEDHQDKVSEATEEPKADVNEEMASSIAEATSSAPRDLRKFIDVVGDDCGDPACDACTLRAILRKHGVEIPKGTHVQIQVANLDNN